MFRERVFFKVEDVNGWNEMSALCDEINAHLEKKGMITSTLWTQSWGPFNEVVIETDYPDLATYEKERSMMMSDADLVPLFERVEKIRVPNWGHNEMWENAEPVRT